MNTLESQIVRIQKKCEINKIKIRLNKEKEKKNPDQNGLSPVRATDPKLSELP